MKTSLSTGGYQDYVELTPETLREVTDLLRIKSSEFIVRPELFFMDISNDILRLRIYVSETRPKARELTPEEREELDRQA